MSTRAEFFQSMYPGLSNGEVIDELIKASIYNKEDRHTKKSWPGFTCSRGWLQHYGYNLHRKRGTSGELRNKTIWWVTKL